MSYSPSVAVDVAKRDVGFHEGPNNSNPYSLWQYGSRYNPYCLSATCYWSYAAGFRFWSDCTFKEKGESYTPTYKIRAKTHGVWRDKHWKANPGDDVEFDWGNNGLIDHVEKVVFDDGVTLITIGANTSNGVYYRRRDRQYVAGFVALSEAGQGGHTPIVEDEMKLTDRVDAVVNSRLGRYVLQADGGVLTFGAADFRGSYPGLVPKQKPLVVGKNHAVGIVLTPTEKGYWILLFDGHIYSFGDAKYHNGFSKDFIPGGYIRLVPWNDGYRAVRSDGAVPDPR